MDISAIAREFIDVNQRRKELEKREEYLKGALVQHFQATGAKHLETEAGKVSYLEAQKVDYDIPLLRQALPASVFELVTKVSVNDAVLSQLLRDGKVDAAAVERARKVSLVHRVVAQASQPSQAARKAHGQVSRGSPGKRGSASAHKSR
ncbi:MAG: siphovirus Gp157 family protein [Bacillota bacterium]|nr:siphovirus Gp157 family protein [Bacillota bacterium]